MDANLVSVIVPVYNVEPYLKKCISSILCQTYKELEVIIVDDGSTDDSLSICKKFECSDNRVKVFHQENAGVSAARNFALEIMSGSYVLFVDADDWIESNMVEILVNELKKDKLSDVVFCGYKEIEDSTNKVLKSINPDSLGRVKKEDGVAEIFGIYSTMLWNKLFRTTLLEKKVLFDQSLKIGEDELWMVEVLKNCRSIILIGEALYNYRYRFTGVSKDFTISDARMTDYESQKKVLQAIADYHSDYLTQCAQKRLYYTGQKIMKIAYYERRYDIYEMIDHEIEEARNVWFEQHSNKLGKIRRKFVEMMMRKRVPGKIVKIFDK
mgnify:CR=1 FL=1